MGKEGTMRPVDSLGIARNSQQLVQNKSKKFWTCFIKDYVEQIRLLYTRDNRTSYGLTPASVTKRRSEDEAG